MILIVSKVVEDLFVVISHMRLVFVMIVRFPYLTLPPTLALTPKGSSLKSVGHNGTNHAPVMYPIPSFMELLAQPLSKEFDIVCSWLSRSKFSKLKK